MTEWSSPQGEREDRPVCAQLALSQWVVVAVGLVIGLVALGSATHAGQDEAALDVQATATPPDGRVSGTVTGFGNAVDAGPTTGAPPNSPAPYRFP
jgi:hypothetical protein